MEFDSYLVIPLVSVAFCLGLLIVLIFNGKRHVARRPFSMFLVFMALWGFFIFMMRSSGDLTSALFWEKFVFGAILSSSLFFYIFTMALTGVRPKKMVEYPLYALYFIVIAFIPTGLVVSGVREIDGLRTPVIGLAPLFVLYVLSAYAPLVRSTMLLVGHYRRSRVIDDRVRDQYIIFGMAAMFIGATTDYIRALGVSMYPLGIISNILFCFTATIAVLRYNLLEMKVVLRKGITISLTSLLVFGVFFSLIYLLSVLVHDFFSPMSLTIIIMAVFMAAIIYQPVFVRFQQMVDRWFFRERYDHIQVLKRFTQETRGDLDLEQLAASLVTAVANGMQGQGVYLLVPSPATGSFTTYTYAGQKNRGRLFFSGKSPLVVAMQQQEGIIDGNDLETMPSLVSMTVTDRQALETNGIELIVPLKNNDNLAGMLLLSNKLSKEPYTNEERQILQSVSTDVAVNIENAHLYENMKRKQSELQKAMDGIIHAISRVVETRDPYTAGHQRRVAELARTIAREMALSEWQTTGIFVAGLLHDVGKVAVPSEILAKPGKISQYEFSIIKNHSQIGYDILQKIDFPWPVTRAVIQHHERIDGSGYPRGLSGDDIIIEARILGVADVVEAMSSHRPYRPALGLHAALEEISRSSGILFDPEVVDACLRILGKDETRFDRIMAAAANSQERALETVLNSDIDTEITVVKNKILGGKLQ
jgi:putative nucleotidyltransferase with HDIG domain